VRKEEVFTSELYGERHGRVWSDLETDLLFNNTIGPDADRNYEKICCNDPSVWNTVRNINVLLKAHN
jgi:hypothetical protein